MSASPDPSSSQTSRKPPPTIPFANWPTIKILNPPQGRFSPRTDERCLMYCSQSVTGRFHRKEPYCRAICIRKVFTHEVRNIVSFRTHRNVDAEGKAKFLLPKEGQPENLPKYLGGIDHEDEEDEERSQPSRQKGDAAKYWDEGWYFWHTKSSQGVWEKVLTMRRDLESQQQYDVAKDKRKQDWEQYQEYLKEVQGAAARTQPSTEARAPDRWYGPIVPPPPMQDITPTASSASTVQQGREPSGTNP
ncbi:hypothetical protein ONZ45_g7996 [Pleurotus djamor]|nr:hypothetical protein ONZ45_g7996 [Pleurotus djamor]